MKIAICVCTCWMNTFVAEITLEVSAEDAWTRILEYSVSERTSESGYSSDESSIASSASFNSRLTSNSSGSRSASRWSRRSRVSIKEEIQEWREGVYVLLSGRDSHGRDYSRKVGVLPIIGEDRSIIFSHLTMKQPRNGAVPSPTITFGRKWNKAALRELKVTLLKVS